jgi:predicted ATPase
MASGQVLSLCNFLAQAACPVALWTGDLSTADRYTALLYERTARDALEIWQAYADCFKGEHLVKVGDTDTGLSLLEAGIDKLRHAGFAQYLTSFLAALAEGFLTAGLAQAGRATIEQALARCKATGERWCIAELHRIRGEIAMLEGGPGAVAAEEDFRLALDWSRRQDVLSYALRAATSFARLRHLQGRTRDARDVLEPVYRRFREGFGTADLQYAKTLLGELR